MCIRDRVDNLGPEKYMVLHLKGHVKSDMFEEERLVFHEIMNNPNIIEEIKKNIHVKDNILADLEKVNQIEDKESSEYMDLRDKVIQVDEFIC